MNATEFWHSVHGHLDAQRDPLDDDAIQGFLLEHPEHLTEFAGLTHAVRAVEATPIPRSRSPRLVAAAAALACITAAAGWWFYPSHSDPSEPTLVLPDHADVGRVLRYTVSHHVVSPDGVTERRLETGQFSVHEHSVTRHETPAVTSANGHPIYTELSRLRSRVRPDSLDE